MGSADPDMTILEVMEIALRHHQAGRLAEAEAIYRQVLAQVPEHSDAQHLLGAVALQTGRGRLAVELTGRAVSHDPCHPEYRNTHALALLGEGELNEAIEHHRRAVELEPARPQYWMNLGNALAEAFVLDEAAGCLRRAIEIRADYAEAWRGLGLVLLRQGRVPEAMNAYRAAVGHAPAAGHLHSAMLLALHYDPELSPEELFAEHVAWARRYPECGTGRQNPWAERSRIRIGYVSPDFREHAAAFFIEPILAGHDRDRFEVYCYGQVARPDAVTERLMAYGCHWRSTVAMGDAALAAMIRRDRINVLVDLAGHTAGNRLTVFPHRVAPVQVTYLGYPNTTGLECIDYRISDAHLDPPQVQELSSERIVRLDGTFACYRPAPDAPAVREPPTVRNGFITFGSFNSLAKLNDRVVGLWARILLAVPGSRLLLKTAALKDEPTRRLVAGRFERAGVSRQRLILEADEPFREHLEAYGRMDIMLDPFPFNGHTTSLHGQWMGVPMVALAGRSHASRRGAMILRNMGMDDLIACDEDGYAQKAAELAGHVERLGALREGMRGRLAGSVLADAGRLVGALEEAYRRMLLGVAGTGGGSESLT